MMLRSAAARVSRSAIQRRTLAHQRNNLPSAGWDAEKEKPVYSTKANFEQRNRQQRLKSDTESGHRPTAMQKRFLVLTRLYEKKEDIPALVQPGTMRRLHSRTRGVIILTLVSIFLSIKLISEQLTWSKINRDRAAGKSIE